MWILKLIGSKTEQEIRNQLIISRKSLFEEDGNIRLVDALKKEFSELKSAYILQWIPEQVEDFYKVLINESLVINIELSRDQDSVPIIIKMLVSEYKKGLSKINQIKLQVALDLVKKDLN
ncbi:hypothetical protein [Paenibacillus daejeonensis]|uniref:hypothetical protein n=1 Tax=Paenibacillus daejeonensis TaxID=135193 RepID=UPI0003719B43|nr:hypothetical protein [Paenibacillus daejeonensis]